MRETPAWLVGVSPLFEVIFGAVCLLPLHCQKVIVGVYASVVDKIYPKSCGLRIGMNIFGHLGFYTGLVAHTGLRHRRAWIPIAAATLSGNSLKQTAHTHRASVHQAVKLVAAYWLGR